MRFGNVTPSYGGSETYGPDGYDFGYAQYYNESKALPASAYSLIQGKRGQAPYFPPASTACLPSPLPSVIHVVDADTVGHVPSPKIPCFGGNFPNAYNWTTTGEPGASPELAAAYAAFVMSQLSPLKGDDIDLGGSKVYIAFSGEPEFLGGSAWTLELINQFHDDLAANLTRLRGFQPPLFPAERDPSTLEFAIWNFDEILANIELP